MKLQVFGFAAVVVMAVAGVDYSMQARTSEQSLGLAAYVDTITGRFQVASEARALKSRQNQEAKIHLPEAPEGWMRREWAEADTSRFEAISREMTSWEMRTSSAIEVAPMMGGMVATDIQLATRLRRETIWVYERGDEIIALRVIYSKPGKGRRFPGLDSMIEEANLEGIKSAVPYAFVRGVGFGEIQVDHAMVGPVTYRKFSASMGSDIMIAVRAVALDSSVLAMIDAIDYEGLNGMLDLPLTGVGKNAPEVNPVQAVAMAEQALKQRRAAMGIEEPVVPEPVDDAGQEQGEARPDIETVKEKGIGIGLQAVTSMPGQKCVRKAGSTFCSGFSSE